jgi:hypothetical protein
MILLKAKNTKIILTKILESLSRGHDSLEFGRHMHLLYLLNTVFISFCVESTFFLFFFGWWLVSGRFSRLIRRGSSSKRSFIEIFRSKIGVEIIRSMSPSARYW